MWQRSTLRSQVSPVFEPFNEVAMQVPENLLPLLEKLRALSDADLELVVQAARARAKERELRTVSWESLQEAKGIVSLGGNADDDCKALYDGDDVK